MCDKKHTKLFIYIIYVFILEEVKIVEAAQIGANIYNTRHTQIYNTRHYILEKVKIQTMTAFANLLH